MSRPSSSRLLLRRPTKNRRVDGPPATIVAAAVIEVNDHCQRSSSPPRHCRRAHAARHRPCACVFVLARSLDTTVRTPYPFSLSSPETKNNNNNNMVYTTLPSYIIRSLIFSHFFFFFFNTFFIPENRTP